MSYKDNVYITENRLIEMYTNEQEFEKLNQGHVCKGSTIYKEGLHTIVFKAKAKCITNFVKGHPLSREEGYHMYITPYALVDMTDVNTVEQWKKNKDTSVERLRDIWELLEKTCNELDHLQRNHIILESDTRKAVEKVMKQVESLEEYRIKGNNLYL
ncbi:hypothetical protein TAFFO16_282 [Bacillus phage Taffo16]|uniref:Uncharacterized protein n=1 Tax=Bacillus phage Taffo16 TaxID=2030094 RepID=A0A249XVN3_9CAUD|nr:hypothetical protein TAFFO16_282 [Bacillus phage Taffo16]ULF48908.1 hypothetical protein [Bacillus phage BillyBob]